MTADRIALICDCEGNVAALHAALRAMKQHAPDSIVGAGDILASPFSPDPPSETIALLRSELVESIWPRSPIYDAKVSDAALRMLANVPRVTRDGASTPTRMRRENTGRPQQTRASRTLPVLEAGSKLCSTQATGTRALAARKMS